METDRRLTLLLYDDSWGLSIFRPAEQDPVYCATADWSRLPQADVVLFHAPTAPALSRLRKYAGQQWALYSMESDANYQRQRDTKYLAHFDFTMTYRWDSDVPLMYCARELRDLVLQPPKPKTAAAEASFFASNPRTSSGRTAYVRELMQFLPVDSYGGLFRNRELPLDEGRPTKLETIARYRFDLAFENSLCPDYVTEKFFDPLLAGCVPVYRGAPNIEEFAPGGNCFINTADFESPRELAGYLLHLAKNPAEYESYFGWRERPLREGFLKKIEIATTDPLRRLCSVMLARESPRSVPKRWQAFPWPWRRQAGTS